jgi:hypothetical protein
MEAVMIGPRGKRDTRFSVSSPETFFDLGADNVQENPPRQFDPKTEQERLTDGDLQRRIDRGRKRLRQTRKCLTQKERNLIALAIYSGVLQDGSEAAWVLREIGKREI